MINLQTKRRGGGGGGVGRRRRSMREVPAKSELDLGQGKYYNLPSTSSSQMRIYGAGAAV